jgi:tripartite motif-containing protein 71
VKYFILVLLVLAAGLLPLACGSNDSTGPTGPTPTPTPGHGFNTSWNPTGGNLRGIAILGNTVYVADASGDILTSNLTGGSPATFVTAPGQAYGVAVDASGNVYVSTGVARVIKYNSSASALVTFGTTNGSSTSQLDAPYGLDVDSDGNVYIADNSNNRIVKLDSNLSFSATFTDAFSVNFSYPYDVKVSGTDLYVLDSGHDRIVKMTTAGAAVTQWGSHGTGNGEFSMPEFLEIDHRNGNIYVADSTSYRVQLLNPSGTYMSQWGGHGTGDSQFGGSVPSDSPRGIAVDSTGKVYVVDQPATSAGHIKVFGP